MSTSFFTFFVLRQPVCRENINFHHHKRLQRSIIEHLTDSDWLKNGYGQNCIITSPTGIGKTYLAYALAQKACRGGSKRVMFLLTRTVPGTERQSGQWSFADPMVKKDVDMLNAVGDHMKVIENTPRLNKGAVFLFSKKKVTAQVQPKKINHRWTLINTDIKLFFCPSGFR